MKWKLNIFIRYTDLHSLLQAFFTLPYGCFIHLIKQSVVQQKRPPASIVFSQYSATKFSINEQSNRKSKHFCLMLAAICFISSKFFCWIFVVVWLLLILGNRHASIRIQQSSKLKGAQWNKFYLRQPYTWLPRLGRVAPSHQAYEPSGEQPRNGSHSRVACSQNTTTNEWSYNIGEQPCLGMLPTSRF